MGDRDVVRAKMRGVLEAGMTPDQVADAVADLFWPHGTDIIETDTTRLGDAYRQVLWAKVLVLHLHLETGSYQGGPVRG